MIKKIVLLICLIAGLSFGQEKEIKLTTTSNQAIKQHQDDSYQQPKLTKKQLLRAKSERRKKMKGEYAPDQPDKFIQFHQEIRTAKDEKHPLYKHNYTMVEFNKSLANQSLSKSNSNIVWQERGPGNVAGRTRSVIVDFADPTKKTWFSAAVSGGIWKTTNEGQAWIEITKGIPNLSTNCLAQSKSNPNVIYCGTGEGFGNVDAVGGNGLIKSTDHGVTWQQVTSTVNDLTFKNINRVIVDPTDENIVLVCANGSSSLGIKSSIQKSIDGGLTWTKVYEANSRIQQLVANPNSFDTLYAAINAIGVAKSTDKGTSWTIKSTGLLTKGRIEIAIADKNPNYLFASIDQGDNSALYYSKDASENWTEVKSSTGSTPAWLGGQGWYDNTIGVSPLDETKVFLGGIDVYTAKLSSQGTSSKTITSVTENVSQQFMGFINWGGAYLGGGLDKASVFWDFLKTPTQTVDSEYVSVEFRFGPGKKQKAHRFINNAGVYEYKDYVEVPFEIWDITNNKQLMASFRDKANNGVFDVYAYNASDRTREYVTAHTIPYSDTPNTNMQVNNGIVYKGLYSFWPELLSSFTWDPNNLPESKITVIWSTVNAQLATFNKITNWYSGTSLPYIHADQHNTTMVDNGNGTYRIIMGNDGGVFYSDDEGASWVDANNGFNTTQFYGADKKPNSEEFLGGMQDNGTWRSPVGSNATESSNYEEKMGGDGYLGAWKYDDGNKVIGALYYNRFNKSINNGVSFSASTVGLLDNGEGNGPFITVVGKSNSDPELLVTTGKTGVWRSENFADSWSAAQMDSTVIWGYSGSHTPVEISVADPRIVWAGAYMLNGYPIQVSTDGGITFKATNNYASYGRITGLASHPTEPNTGFALLSLAQKPKILKTTDLGNTWIDLSGFGNNTVSSNGFPDVAVYDLLVMPYNTNIYWAFTEIGIYQSTDAGLNWSILNEPDFRAVCVWQANIVNDMVVLATHGRGIWTAKIPELANYTPPAITLSPTLKKVDSTPIGAVLSIKLRSVYDSTSIYIDNTILAKISATTIKDTVLTIALTQNISGNLQIVSYKNNQEYKSAKTQVSFVAFKAAQSLYMNNFDGNNEGEFFGDFEISLKNGFNSNAIHSPHPYGLSSTYIYTLLTPIVVSNTYPYLHYKDIAIVEPGDQGSKYGDNNYWDYVVVEGSKDGITWKALANGYDCDFDSKWRTAYDASSAIDSTYFRSHMIDLSKSFNAGDQIIIRFRLYSDEAVENYGWVIDDLEIQGRFTDIKDNSNILPNSYVLEQNYPNPFNPTTTIKFALPKKSKVTIRIFNILGQEIAKLIDNELNAGYHNVKWNASNLSSGTYIYRIETDEFVQSKKLQLIK